VTKRPENGFVGAARRLAIVTLLTGLLVALLGFVAPPASATPLLQPQTRVAAIEQPASHLVAPHSSVLAVQGRQRAPNYDQDATGSSVAAEDATAASGTGLPFNDPALEQRITQTLDNIDSGNLPYSKDGTVFQNREGLLPSEPAGYYHEYTVDDPGVAGRGVDRLVIGANGELYFTPNHYASFVRIG
jgi:ribonuclease T1